MKYKSQLTAKKKRHTNIRKSSSQLPKTSTFIFRLFFPFTYGYFMAVIMRNMNVILAPDMIAELNLTDSTLGLLTGGYFLSFSLAQIPLGILLDRYDTKFIQAVLMLIAASGVALVAQAQTPASLFWGRCLAGLGLSGSLLATYKIYQLNLPAHKQGNYSYKTLSIGILGGFICGAPLQYLLNFWDWRQLSAFVAFLLFLASMMILIFSPRVTIDRRRLLKNPLYEIWVDLIRGVRKVFIHPVFWKCAPFALITYGGSLAVQSLWLGTWLRRVEGMGMQTSGNLLSTYTFIMFISAWLISMLLARQEKWHWHPERIMQWMMIFHLFFSFIAIIGIPWISLISWGLFYATSSACTLSFLVVANSLPRRFKGRAMTSYNCFVFGGAFLIQWLMGYFFEVFNSLGHSSIDSLRLVFLFWMILQAIAFVVLFGMREVKTVSLRIPLVR